METSKSTIFCQGCATETKINEYKEWPIGFKLKTESKKSERVEVPETIKLCNYCYDLRASEKPMVG